MPRSTGFRRRAGTFAPFPKPDDDAYRSYLIGLGKEALAYQLAAETDDRHQGGTPEPSSETR